MTTAVMLSRLALRPLFGSPPLTRPTRIQAATADDEPGDHVGAQQHPVGADAGQPSRLRVVARGVQMSAPGGLRSAYANTTYSSSIMITPTVMLKLPMLKVLPVQSRNASWFERDGLALGVDQRDRREDATACPA